jgi:hypothetical protein
MPGPNHRAARALRASSAGCPAYEGKKETLLVKTTPSGQSHFFLVDISTRPKIYIAPVICGRI